ncbi:hypothetical protein A3N46_19830 [Enterobacter asburiae]|nr:hypothetical protein A3N46_19830 [Enterobacter asburiae]
MMSLWDALRMNMMISYQELVRTFPSSGHQYLYSRHRWFETETLQKTLLDIGFINNLFTYFRRSNSNKRKKQVNFILYFIRLQGLKQCKVQKRASNF